MLRQYAAQTPKYTEMKSVNFVGRTGFLGWQSADVEASMSVGEVRRVTPVLFSVPEAMEMLRMSRTVTLSSSGRGGW